MGIIRGHEDLKPREVVGLAQNGNLLVSVGEDIIPYCLFIGPGGQLIAQPKEKPAASVPDQLVSREEVPLAAKWVGVDQS